MVPQKSFVIYHNPRCSKSRQALAILREAGIEPQVVPYLETPPTVDELRSLVGRLDVAPDRLVRRKEAKEAGMPDNLSEDELLAFLAAHPRVIERPIVDRGDRAVLGRPPEKVRELL